MKSLWSDRAAAAFVSRYAERGTPKALALRIYSSRLLGAEPALVQHGGGNTSVKLAEREVTGESVPVLRVKGSGWDLGDIEPQGMPAVRMAPLLRLRELEQLSDEAMVSAQRGALMDAAAPNPSVETLLHAWIPHRVVDHTHANAVLALTDQPDGEARCRAVFGDRLAVAAYCMPGFALAKLADRVVAAHPDAIGMVLLKHGVFTWGDTAQESYERMIETVSQAEAAISEVRGRRAVVAISRGTASLADVAPILRGALAQPRPDGLWRRVVLDHRGGPLALAYASGREAARYSQVGPVTPDHVLRLKPWPLLLPAPQIGDLPAFVNQARTEVAAFMERYRAYFDRLSVGANPPKTMLDPGPRWALVPGLGLFGIGGTALEARVAADVGETTAATVLDAEAVGRFESISEADIFDVEYWSLEQAKLGKAKPKALAGQVALVTGGGGVIGAAIAQTFAAEGAVVAVLDRDAKAASGVAAKIGGLALICDVTQPGEVEAAMAAAVEAFGGVDIIVSNAGAAYSGNIAEAPDARLRESFELNFFAHQYVARAAVKVMLLQKTGGALLFNASKQPLNPAAGFGPYGTAKAALLALMRQYAVEHGGDGIRSNAVNGDRIRSGLLTPALVAERSAARGLSEADYMSGNLLGREVTPRHVAQAFLSLALAERTTAAILTVDGGNIAAAVR